MNYAILRTKKLKTVQQIQIAGMHNDRTLKVANANPEISSLLVAGSPTPRARYEELITKLNIKERANGVKAVEIVLTFSPEAKKHIPVRKWTEANITWLKKEFGSSAILNAQLHMDETTPHIHAIIIPVKKKKGAWCLCCRDFLGGASKLSALQDRYALAMSEFGLHRGIKRSNATHEEIKSFYSNLHQPEKPQPTHALPKLSIWNYAKNNEAFTKLKSITVDLLKAASRITTHHNLLKQAYLKEREYRKEAHIKLLDSEKERSALKRRLSESESREKQYQKDLYNELPKPPCQANFNPNIDKTMEKQRHSKSFLETNKLQPQTLDLKMDNTDDYDSNYSEIPLSPLEKLEQSIRSNENSTPSTSITHKNSDDNGTTSSVHGNSPQLAPQKRQNKKERKSEGYNFSM